MRPRVIDFIGLALAITAGMLLAKCIEYAFLFMIVLLKLLVAG